MAEPSRRYRFRHRQRLHGRRAFAAVFEAGLRYKSGPISLCVRPNDLGYNRYGLSVPRRVGKAVQRARIKRRLREAIRLTQHEVPQGYDVVVVVRPHEAMHVDDYQSVVTTGLERLHQRFEKQAESRKDEA